MKTRNLGNSRIKTSLIGLGCWNFGGGDYWGKMPQNIVNSIVQKAYESGINYFDTAEVYNNGLSEKSLGNALQNLYIRDEVIIGSKISPSNCSPENIRIHLEESLKRIQTDYLDIYMVHWPIESHSIEHFTSDKQLVSNPAQIDLAFSTLIDLKKEGKIKEIGISNHGIEQMEEIFHNRGEFIANELPYNLFSRAIEVEIEPYCIKNNIGIIGYMALQQGILAGKYSKIEDIPPAQAHSRHFKQGRGLTSDGRNLSRHHENGVEDEMEFVLKELKKISIEEDVSISQISLSWAISNENISCTLVGTKDIEHLENNLRAIDYKLPSSIKKRLNKLSDPILEKLGSNPDYYENRNNSRIR